MTTALCVNQEVGNAALDLRCQGFADGLAEQVALEALAVIGRSDWSQSDLGGDHGRETINGILTLDRPAPRHAGRAGPKQASWANQAGDFRPFA